MVKTARVPIRFEAGRQVSRFEMTFRFMLWKSVTGSFLISGLSVIIVATSMDAPSARYEKDDGIITPATNQILEQGVDVGTPGMALGVWFLDDNEKEITIQALESQKVGMGVSFERTDESSMILNLESAGCLARGLACPCSRACSVPVRCCMYVCRDEREGSRDGASIRDRQALQT